MNNVDPLTGLRRLTAWPGRRHAAWYAGLLLALQLACRSSAAEGAWPFFAMQTATKDAAHVSAEAQVQLVKTLGYDGIGAVPPAEVDAFAQACDRHQVRLWNTYFTLDVEAPLPLDPELAGRLAPLKGRNALLWVGLTSRQHKPSDPSGDAAAVKLVQALANLAESLGARVALYPHAGFWIERTADAVRVADVVNRPGVGVTFNLCHFLKVEDEARLGDVLEAAKARLFVVSLNGAESGRPGADWKELIQTLDRGTFDNRRLLRTLRQIGFAGPVGFQGYGIGGDAADNLRRTISAWRALNSGLAGAAATGAVGMGFQADGEGGFTFETGVVRGRLHARGRSLGLTEVVHNRTGARLDGSNGLLSHYRVFTKGVRYGGGAWDWPSTVVLRDTTTVEVTFADSDQRPFSLRAIYRLLKPSTIEVETVVTARREIAGFEVFLASYFNAAFTNASVMVKAGGAEDLVDATRDRGDWQMYVRDAGARALAEDGRWRLEPNPVDWKFPFELAGPRVMAQRRAVGPGLSAMLTALTTDCFAVAMPHEAEGHYSMYLSLFGRPLRAAETVGAKVQLIVGALPRR